MIACQCPLARLVTLEVDRSLWRDPNSSVIRRDVSVPSFRTYVTETFFTLGKPIATLNHLRRVLASHPWCGEIELIPSELITQTATSINLGQKC